MPKTPISNERAAALLTTTANRLLQRALTVTNGKARAALTNAASEVGEIAGQFDPDMAPAPMNEEPVEDPAPTTTESTS